MDVFAHYFWASGLFWNKKKRWFIGLFGVLPDLLTFAPFFLFEFNDHVLRHARPEIADIPSYIFTMYNFTHSLVMWAFYAIIVYIFLRQYFILMFGWLLHIVLDIFTHTDAFFPTPLFWPISNWHYPLGVSWGTASFMLVNYSALALLYVLIGVHSLQKKAKARRKL